MGAWLIQQTYNTWICVMVEPCSLYPTGQGWAVVRYLRINHPLTATMNFCWAHRLMMLLLLSMQDLSLGPLLLHNQQQQMHSGEKLSTKRTLCRGKPALMLIRWPSTVYCKRNGRFLHGGKKIGHGHGHESNKDMNQNSRPQLQAARMRLLFWNSYSRLSRRRFINLCALHAGTVDEGCRSTLDKGWIVSVWKVKKLKCTETRQMQSFPKLTTCF